MTILRSQITLEHILDVFKKLKLLGSSLSNHDIDIDS